MIKKGKLCEVSSEKVQVGDILHLREDQEVPCDVIVLSSSHSQVSETGDTVPMIHSCYVQGQCYVMTANLDGETSLKTRLSAQLTKQAKQVKSLVSMYGCIECENPNPKLDSFLGRLTVWSCKEGDETEVLL